VQSLSEEEKAAAHEQWMKMYFELKAFKEKNGNALPPCTPRTPLYAWAQKQRNDYKKFLSGSISDMTALKVHYLNEIQFPFSATRLTVPWDERFEELKLYKAKYGNILVPRSYPGKIFTSNACNRCCSSMH
jgi:hypothetical protein